MCVGIVVESVMVGTSSSKVMAINGQCRVCGMCCCIFGEPSKYGCVVLDVGWGSSMQGTDLTY